MCSVQLIRLVYIPQQHRVRLISKFVSLVIVGTPHRKHSNYTLLLSSYTFMDNIYTDIYTNTVHHLP